jgi:hypothetical protein
VNFCLVPEWASEVSEKENTEKRVRGTRIKTTVIRRVIMVIYMCVYVTLFV